jgi:GT2 family glycosyltransferase
MSDPCLSISIVTYKPDHQQFAEALRSLNKAVLALQARRLFHVKLTIIDNANEAVVLRPLLAAVTAASCNIIASKENIGYGRAHNFAITSAESDYHLIMNPDVILDEQALVAGIEYLAHNSHVVAVSPDASNCADKKLYLCKTFPSVMDLGLRGFAPGFLKTFFVTRLATYENRVIVDHGEAASVDLISGCFMLCRTQALRTAGGFNRDFFLYFEDFALSLELKKIGTLMYLPSCRIIHFGGDAGNKGFRHVMYFVASAVRFFRIYGWRFF